jgi:predicted PurR-regulated permease PerM
MDKPGRRPRPEQPEASSPTEIKVVQNSGLTPEGRRERSMRARWIEWAAILLTVYLAIQLLGVAGAVLLKLLPILLLVIFAALLAFLLAPLVRRLVSVGFPRTLAALTVYLGIFILMGFFGSWISGPLGQQFTSLAKNYPTYLSQIETTASHFDEWTVQHGLPSFNATQLVTALPSSLVKSSSILSSAFGIATTVVGSIINIVLTFVIGFYLLRDGETLKSRLRNVLPAGFRSKYDFGADALAFVVGGYVRAQVVMALIIGTLAGVGCAVIGVHYAVVIGVTVGILELVPIFGALVGSLIALAIASFQGINLLLFVAGWFLVIHFLEAYVLGPRITGVRVALHPLIALLAMLIGIDMAGFLGALFAVPLAGLINVFIRAFYWEVRAENPRAFGALPPVPVTGWRRVWAQLRVRKAERKVP